MPNEDPWSSDAGEEYSPDRVFTKSTDGRGHYEKITATVKPELLPVIGQMVASGDIPEYRTAADFFRDAIYHRLHYWTDQRDSGWTTDSYELIHEAQVESVLAQQARREGVVAKLTDACSRATKNADLGALGRCQEMAESYANEYPQPWARKFQEIAEDARAECQVRARYAPGLSKGKPIASR